MLDPHLRHCFPISVTAIASWVRSASSIPKVNTICKIIFQAVIYQVWKERNSRIHGITLTPTPVIIREVQKLVRASLASLDRPSRGPFTALTTNSALSYLSTWFGHFQF
ncbi:hypothetical protein V5N11_012309 [Cardamine amara subsp. amara]|uniref:Uncharacterized protein n=1 Tax=Cardamine amara subsp. amara TaxID=228776 RepID=A0ABD0ZSR2_CARAN